MQVNKMYGPIATIFEMVWLDNNGHAIWGIITRVKQPAVKRVC